MEDLQVIPLNDLRNYIWRIANEERYSNGYPMDHDRILQTIGKYEGICPYPPEEKIIEEVYKRAQGGIYCCYCGNFDVTIGVKYIRCSCGMHESRDEAIVRTICEYGVIHYKENFTTTKLTEFFDGDISRNNIFAILNKYFEKVGSYKNAEYINKGVSFIHLYDDFYFSTCKKFLFDQAIPKNTTY